MLAVITASLFAIARIADGLVGADLMHGRVGMLAAVVFLVQEKYHPLFGGAVNGPAIGHIPQIPPIFWACLVLTIGLAEAYRIQIGWAEPAPLPDSQFKLRDEYTLGDFGFDTLRLKSTGAAELKLMQLKEINNGRLAMIAAAAFLAQEAAAVVPPAVPVAMA
ncbi:chlorophyll a/b-binding protein domain-containing protein [Pavlovales sp. CCMP2436]|nr:chlorophyll a/b-binding protein domain-containing protein [Pavlovales sp. CCMP2436]